MDISRFAAYQWRNEDAEFAAEWDAALEIGVTALEDEAHRRAFSGEDEPVYYGGAQCGSVKRYSDTLAIFLLKAHRPDRYRENSRLELTGANGGPVRLSDTERTAKLKALLAMAQQRRDGDIDDLV